MLTPYGTKSEFESFLSDLGITAPPGANLDAALNKGSIFVDGAYGARFVGVPTDPNQDRAWPRTGAVIYGATLLPNVIPWRVIHAAYQAAIIEMNAPGTLLPNGVAAAPQMKSVKAGPAEVEWFERAQVITTADGTPVVSVLEGLLEPLLLPKIRMPAILVV